MCPTWVKGDPQLVSFQGIWLQAKMGLAGVEGVHMPWAGSTRVIIWVSEHLLQNYQLEIHDVERWAPMCFC